MEMASAHGLALKLVEMNRLERINRNELCEIISEEDKIIKSWYLACRSRFSKKDFFTLMRRTILFVFSSSSLKEAKKKELLKATSVYFNHFSNFLNSWDVRKPLFDVIVDPWKNKYFSWEELFQKRLTFRDYKVQQYFYAEPEEIVLARVHLFSKQGKDDVSMIMAKNSFLFHSRVAKSFKQISKGSMLDSNKSRKGIASMDWYLLNLRRKRNLSAVYNELKQLTCHEGVLLIMRLRGLKFLPFALSIAQIFIMEELIQPSRFCCTKKLFTLWALLHKEKTTPVEEIFEEIRKLIAIYAPSSAHFYIVVDALWQMFGMSLVNMYVELYIRGLTLELNLLEVAKHQNKIEDVNYLLTHISLIFYKLSTLFTDSNDQPNEQSNRQIARECMFSAFSLKPCDYTLAILQSMSLSIRSESSLNNNVSSIQESTTDHVLDHPLLMKGIPNIPYAVVQDLVSVLESLRCFHFQYNVFDWQKNFSDLSDYLKDYNLCKMDTDTECEEDSDPVFPPKSESTNISPDYLQTFMKRKSESFDSKEVFPFEVGANVEVENAELTNKRIKLDQSNSAMIDAKDPLNTQKVARPSDNYGQNTMENVIEQVIRTQLDNKQKFNHANESESSVYPYSLTNYEKDKNINSNKQNECSTPLTSIKSSDYPYFSPSPSVLSRALTSPSARNKNLISPILYSQKNSSAIKEQSCNLLNQNKYIPKLMNDPYYSKSKNIQTDTMNSDKKVVAYQQEAHNLSKSTSYGQVRNVSNRFSESPQYITNQATMQVVHRPSVASDFPKEQFLSNTPVRPSNSMTAPLNLTQPKLNTAQSPHYLPPAHHHISKTSSDLRTDSRYQASDNKTFSTSTVKKMNENTSFQDVAPVKSSNQLVHYDRSSVIQHTMQHVKETNSQEVEMPNQLAVSVNSDAAEQIRNVPKKDITNLPPFRVNVFDRSISSSSLAVSANLVISRKPQPPIEVPAQPVSSNISPVTSDIITIPGMLASTSVIVSPWEAQRKVHGEMMYKKTPQAAAASSIDKRIYKNRLPYGRPVAVTSESSMVGQKVTYDKNNNSQVFKTVAMPSHNKLSIHTIPSTNQNNANASQNWMAVNKSSTSQVVSQPTSSQPWYSAPFPKPQNSKSVSTVSVGHSSTNCEKNIQTELKLFQPGKHESKSFTMYPKQIHPSQSQAVAYSAVTSSLSRSTNNLVSDSSIKSHIHYLTAFAAPDPSTSTVANAVVKSNTVPSSLNSMVNIKTYSMANHKPLKDNSVTSTQLSDGSQHHTELTLNKSPVAYSASNIIDHDLQLSQDLPRTSQNSCCSPSELNPCQNCSLPSENSLIQSTSKKTLSDRPSHMIPSNSKRVLESDLISAACNPSYSTVKDDCNHEQSLVRQVYCPHCSSLFSEFELQNHILNCSSRSLNSLVNEIDSNNMLVSENFGDKTLPNVMPEQNPLFQKETFFNDLPQTAKPFLNVEDDKNLGEIDANAFSDCMDFINSDNDLEGIVQGIGSLDQIDNNYLPYIPSADPAEHFLSNNLCNDIQDDDISEKPLHNSTAYSKIDQINNYDINHGSHQFQERKMSVFDFTESKSVQQPILSKSQVSCTEKISSELTFSAIAEMIKGALTENCPNELESVAMCLNNDPDLNADDVNQHPPVDSASTVDQHSFIQTVENNAQQNIPKMAKSKLKYNCPHCSKIYCSRLSVRRHIHKVHPGLLVEYNKVFCESSDVLSTDVRDNNLKLKDLNSSSGNSYHNNADNFNHVLDSDIKQNFPISDVFENGITLPKGKVKGIIKNPQAKCKFCGKILTMIYMKRHILNVHKEINVKIENSTDLNVDCPSPKNPSLDTSSPADLINMPSVSPLLEQDFDSSTCLSASDALKKNTSYTVTEASRNSDDSGNLVENNNVKFNFNVLEFSRDAESDSRILPSGKNPSLQLESPFVENLKPENILDDLKLENPSLKDFVLEDPPLESLMLENPLENLMLENPPLENLLLENPPLENLLLENPLESIQSFEEKDILGDILHTKHAKHFEQKHPCSICNKSYQSKGNLKRHLQYVHTCFTHKKTNKEIKTRNSKTQLGSCTGLPEVTDANPKSLRVSAKKTSNPASKKISKVKVSNDAEGFIPQTKIHDSTPHSNTNRNLLKTVLQSNFSKKNKLSQKYSMKGTSIPNKQINISDTSEILEKDSTFSSAELPLTRGSLFENITSSNPQLKSSDNTSSALVPFENSSEPQSAIKAHECSFSFKSHSEVNIELSVSTDMQNLPSNGLSEIDINSDVKYPHMADTQNLSVQSCEISPISQIISNVSKCNFGGTSNNDDRKEVFEDNSLKLLIPESKDICIDKSSNDLEEIGESNKLHLIQNEKYNQNKINDDQNNIGFKLDLNCDKSNLDLCNQEIKQDFFQKKLSDTTFLLDNFDVSTKKTHKITSMTSLSCEHDNGNKKSYNIKNISQKNEACTLKNSYLENESNEIAKVFLGNEAYDIENIITDSGSCDFVSENESCEFENNVSDNESDKLENAVSDNKHCKLANTLQGNKSSELEIILPENKSNKFNNSSPTNDSYDFENNSHENISVKDNLLETVCELSSNLQKNELCELETKQNEPSEPTFQSSKNENVLLLENISIQKNDLEKNMDDNAVCEPTFQSSKIDNSLLETISVQNYDLCNLEKNMQENEICEPTFQSSKIDNILSENVSVQKNDSCDLKMNSQEIEVSESTFQSSKIDIALLEDVSVQKKDLGDLEKNMQENEVCEPNFQSSKIDNALLENTSVQKSDLENNVQENEVYEPNFQSSEIDNVLLENTSVEEIDFEKIVQENEVYEPNFQSSKIDNVLLENTSVEKNDLERNVQEKEVCEAMFQSSKIDNALLENIFVEKNHLEKNVHENEVCIPTFQTSKIDNALLKTVSVQKNDLCDLEEICVPTFQSSKIDNALLESTSVQKNDFEENVQENDVCELAVQSFEIDVSLENIAENISQSCKVDTIFPEKVVNGSKDHGISENKLCEYVTTFQEQNDYLKKNEACELENTSINPNKVIMCRLCQENLDSVDILTKHLKDFHDIPVLKKHISEHSSSKKSTQSQDLKLSPPKLKLSTTESDSESTSDFDLSSNCLKDSSQSICKIETLSVNLTVPSPLKEQIEQDNETVLQSKSETSFEQFEHSNENSESDDLLDVQSLSSLISSLNHPRVVTSLNNFRSHSSDDISSVASEKPTDSNREHLSSHLKNKFYINGERKSMSLPNIKISFPSTAISQIECKVKSLVVKNIYVESSLSEDTSYSSINDSIENCKSSCDSSLSSSSSSQNITVPINEITINSNFILPDRVNSSAPGISPKKVILKSKFSGSKLIIQNLFKTYKKKYKKKSKSKLFSRQKIKSNKTFKPIILTLRKATEVDKFLETNKQPIVKLIRLTEKEFNCLTKIKSTPVKINMDPVVKLEKMNIPIKVNNDIDININDEHVVRNPLQQDDQKSVESRKIAKSSRKYYRKLQKRTASSKVSRSCNLLNESIEISDDSSDSVQFLKTVTKKEKIENKSEFCTTPETKKCFVVLKRLST